MQLNNITTSVKFAPGAKFTQQVRLLILALGPFYCTQNKLTWSSTD